MVTTPAMVEKTTNMQLFLLKWTF